MARNVVTLYIDDTGLKLLVTSGKRVEKWAHLPLEPALFSNGAITDEAQVAAKIQKLFKDQRVKTKKVIAGLSELHCLTQPITLPQLPEALLSKAVTQKAESIVPLSLDLFYISWQVIRTAGEEMQVFLTASPRTALDSLIRTLHQAGLRAGDGP